MLWNVSRFFALGCKYTNYFKSTFLEEEPSYQLTAHIQLAGQFLHPFLPREDTLVFELMLLATGFHRKLGLSIFMSYSRSSFCNSCHSSDQRQALIQKPHSPRTNTKKIFIWALCCKQSLYDTSEVQAAVFNSCHIV